jgi:hypothetical protein
MNEQTPTPESDKFSYPLMGKTDYLMLTEMRRLERDRNRILGLLHGAICERVDAQRALRRCVPPDAEAARLKHEALLS